MGLNVIGFHFKYKVIKSNTQNANIVVYIRKAYFLRVYNQSVPERMNLFTCYYRTIYFNLLLTSLFKNKFSNRAFAKKKKFTGVIHT